MTAQRWVRKLHKLLGLIVGIQVLMWMASGLYMTAIPIETIRGNHLVTEHGQRNLIHDDLYPIASLVKAHSPITSITLRNRQHPFAPVYILKRDSVSVFVDAKSGKSLSQLSQSDAEQLATKVFTGDANIINTTMITDFSQAPEASGRPLPLWQVVFDDTFNSTLYIDAMLGDVVAVRSDLWRWFDIFWMLHIMDYDERSNFNNPLVILMVSLGLFLSLSGFVMLGNALKHKGLSGVLK